MRKSLKKIVAVLVSAVMVTAVPEAVMAEGISAEDEIILDEDSGISEDSIVEEKTDSPEDGKDYMDDLSGDDYAEADPEAEAEAETKEDKSGKEEETAPSEKLYASIVNSGSCGPDLTFTVDSNGVLTISGTGEMYDMDIISDESGTYHGAPWAPYTYHYDDYAWEYDDEESESVTLKYPFITKVIINNGVTSIGKNAFADCGRISSIQIPASVTKIHGSAFWGTGTSLKVTVNKNNKVYHAVDNRALIETANNKLVLSADGYIPEGVTEIGAYAFYKSELKSIDIPEGVTSIGVNAFYCSSISSVTLPDSLRNISNYAFMGSCLSKVTFPEGLENIRWDAFDHCCLKKIHIPASVKMIKGNAFGYNNLTKITVDSDNKKYDSRDGCNAIVEKATDTLQVASDNTVIPKSVKNIGAYSFEGRSIQSIIIPEKVKSVGQYAFESSGLESVTIYGSDVELDNLSFVISESDWDIDDVSYVGKMYGASGSSAEAYAKDKGIVFYDIQKQPLKIKVGKTKITAGETTTLTVTGAKGTVSYKSSNDKIAFVSSKGKVRAKKVGKVTITVRAEGTERCLPTTKKVTIKVVPKATASLKVNNTAKGINVSWKKVTGASGYYIYRTDYDGAVVKKKVGAGVLKYTDKKGLKNGKKYVYKVVAYNKSAGESNKSRAKAIYYMTPVKIKSAKSISVGCSKITWTANKKAAGYQIQYSKRKNFSKIVKSVDVPKTSKLQDTQVNLDSGKKYYVRVRTYIEVGGKKYYSAWKSTSIKIK